MHLSNISEQPYLTCSEDDNNTHPVKMSSLQDLPNFDSSLNL